MAAVNAEGSAGLETRIAALETEIGALRGTLAALAEALIVTDAGGRVEYVNPAGLRLLGLSAAAVAGRPLREVLVLVDGDDEMAPEAAIDLKPCLEDGLRLRFDELSLRQPDGRRFAIEATAAAIRTARDADPAAGRGEAITGSVLLLIDASQRQHKAQRWQRAAVYDALTGLLNREAFTEHVARAREAERRGISSGHVLLHLDLDQFQVITDACGHAAGNQLIQWVASLIRERLRDDDVLARLGRDEFGLLVPRSTVDGALQLASDIHAALSFFRFVWQDRSFGVDLSIGLVPFDPDLGSAEELIAAAEKACTLAKAQGRGQSRFFRHDADELRERQGQAQWAMRVRQALEEDHFVLHWQRIRPLQKSAARPLFFEILIRLAGAGGKLHFPGEFLPAVERFGLAGAIDRWVVRKACTMLVRQPPELLAALETVSINLSGSSVGDRAMLDFILEQLAATGCPADRLCFEITETAAISNLHRAVLMIEALREKGCRWALDDFGSGMASYRYLSELPVDYIKIDGKIVAEMLSSPLSWTMVQSIHQMAHVMGARTIAERIENGEILAELERLGLDYGQGYHLDRPRAIVPAEDVAALLAAGMPAPLPVRALVEKERDAVG